MKIAVRYYSRGGNTKKVALAIAEAAGVEARTVAVPLDEKADVLFLGSAVYAAGVDNAVKLFLEENKENIGTVYNFSTASILPSTYKQMQKITGDLGISLSDREYHCRGSFALLHKGHPDEGDLARARAFAKQVVEKAGK